MGVEHYIKGLGHTRVSTAYIRGIGQHKRVNSIHQAFEHPRSDWTYRAVGERVNPDAGIPGSSPGCEV
jgi:hypothetical protein